MYFSIKITGTKDIGLEAEVGLDIVRTVRDQLGLPKLPLDVIDSYVSNPLENTHIRISEEQAGRIGLHHKNTYEYEMGRWDDYKTSEAAEFRVHCLYAKAIVHKQGDDGSVKRCSAEWTILEEEAAEFLTQKIENELSDRI